MAKFRKKPVVIDAYHWNPPEPADKAPEWFYEACQAHLIIPEFNNTVTIRTLEGTMHAMPGDWIIRGVKGEFYPCKPDIFEATYEPA